MRVSQRKHDFIRRQQSTHATVCPHGWNVTHANVSSHTMQLLAVFGARAVRDDDAADDEGLSAALLASRRLAPERDPESPPAFDLQF